MTFLASKIPLIQAPMAGAQGPELAIAVCKAGGLGSLPAAMLTPDRLREQIAAVRQETDAPFNVNFFCSCRAGARSADRSALARSACALLCRGRHRSVRRSRRASRARPSTPRCARPVEETRPAVVSFHFGLPIRGAAFARQSGRRADPCVGHHGRRGALARTPWSRRRSLRRAARPADIAACSCPTTSTPSQV